MYVAGRIEEADIGWFPLHHALVLDSQKGVKDNKLETQIAHLAAMQALPFLRVRVTDTYGWR